MFKKLTSLVLVLLCLLSLPVCAAEEDWSVKEPVWAEIGGGGYLVIDDGEEGNYNTGVRFNALYEFNEVTLMFMWGTLKVSVELYPWNSDYDTTISGMPVYSKPLDIYHGYDSNGKDVGNFIYSIDIGDQVAGEYLLLISHLEGKAVISCQEPLFPEDYVEFFVDEDYASDMFISGMIKYTDSAKTGFGKLLEEKPITTITTAPTQEPSASKAPQATKIPTTTDSEVSNTLTPDSGDAEDPAGSNVILYILLAVGGVAIVAAVVVIVVKSKKKLV